MYLSRIFRMPLLWLLTANLILPCTAAPAPDATRTTKGDAILEGRQAGGGTPTSSQPCATVSNYIARGSNFVPVTLARACLESVPLDKERDAALIDFIVPFINFQSNLDWLADPPREYLFIAGEASGIDILAELDAMRAKVLAGGYKSQYEFTVALEKLISRGRDSHFVLTPRLNMAFQFARDVSLVSVSDDGISPPKLYEVGDLITSLNGIVRREPSPVVLLDDQPILPLLTNLTKGTVTHDLDAGWNALFTSIAKGSSGLTVADYLTLGAYSAYDFTSDISTLTLANGTKLQFRNVAIPNFDFRGVRDGNALHQAVEVNVATVADMLVKRNASTTPCRHPQHRDISKRQTLQNPYRFCRVPHGTSPRPRGYPVPVAEHADHHAGLFLPRSMPGVAVLQIASFSSLYAAVGRDPDCIEADVIEFHRFLLAAMRQLDAAAKALSNGTALKLVVDLQSNPGGFEATVGDVIAQLFPPASSDVATAPPKVRGFTWRARAHAALDWIGARLFSPGQESGTPLLYALHPVPSSQNESLKTFPSWPAFFGPEPLPSPDGASTRRGNSTYPSFRYVHRDRASIDMGATYFSASNPPFPDPASQILVLTDGDCHSACALLANWLVALGARSVALGGRPDTSQRAMELVGGTKGCTPLTYTALQTQSSRAMQVAGFSPAMSQAQRPAFLPAGAGVQPPIALADLTVNTADVFSGGYGDGITGGAVGSTPVQFISRKADCRLYYDREMLLDIEAVWRRAAEAIWASGSSGGKCAGAGSAAARRSMVEADAAKVDHLRRRADALGDVREVQRVSLWGERKGLGDGGLRSKDDIFRSLYMLG